MKVTPESVSLTSLRDTERRHIATILGSANFTDGRRMSRAGLVLGGLAVLLPAALYFNTLDHPFVYDDYGTVVGNRSIQDPTDVATLVRGNLFRSVLALSYSIDVGNWGLEPFGFHVTNIVLHMLNVALVFLLVSRAASDWRALDHGADLSRVAPAFVAGLTAVLFAAHPMMTQAVTYVSGRSEVLCGTWFLLGLLAMREGLVSRRARWIAVSLVALVLGLATKEVAAMLPAVALAYDRLLLGGSREARRRRLLRLHLPLVALMLLGAAARAGAYFFVEPPSAFVARPAPWVYFLTQLHVVWRYVFLLMAPVSQSIFHAVRVVTSPLDLLATAGALGLLAVGVFAVRVRSRAPLVTFGVVWFFLLLVPSSSVVPLQEVMSEHRVYLASVGFFTAVAAAMAWLFARVPAAGRLPRLAGVAAVMLVVASLSVLTVARNRVWADPVTLWRDAARKGPTMWAYFNLGNALREQGDCIRAVIAYRNAIRLNPRVVLPYPDLGACLVELGRLDEARRVLTAALELDPKLSATRDTLRVLDRMERGSDPGGSSPRR
jgi:hypothetical protein